MAKLQVISENVYRFKCPGCGDHHTVPVNPKHLSNGASWGFNFDLNKPTFTPSLLVTSGHYVEGYKSDTCWCTFRKENPDCSFECYRCHSFVTDGRIQFLGDCSHKLAGQTVELPDIE
jgi:hypothetical protein